MRKLIHAFTALSCFCLTLPLLAVEPIAPGDFARLHKLIKPDGNENSWESIPWRPTLTEARREALGEGKPILLWEMDGHPLGCT